MLKFFYDLKKSRQGRLVIYSIVNVILLWNLVWVHDVHLARGVPIVALDATFPWNVPVHLVIVLEVLLGM